MEGEDAVQLRPFHQFQLVLKENNVNDSNDWITKYTTEVAVARLEGREPDPHQIAVLEARDRVQRRREERRAMYVADQARRAEADRVLHEKYPQLPA